MIATILGGLLPLLFVAVLGWLGGRKGLFGRGWRAAWSICVVSFALPLFVAAAHADPRQLTAAAPAVSLGAGLLGIYLLVLSVAWCSGTTWIARARRSVLRLSRRGLLRIAGAHGGGGRAGRARREKVRTDCTSHARRA